MKYTKTMGVRVSDGANELRFTKAGQTVSVERVNSAEQGVSLELLDQFEDRSGECPLAFEDACKAYMKRLGTIPTIRLVKTRFGNSLFEWTYQLKDGRRLEVVITHNGNSVVDVEYLLEDHGTYRIASICTTLSKGDQRLMLLDIEKSFSLLKTKRLG